MTDPRFPKAPPGSYVCEEGWLIVGDEAWTEEQWNDRQWVKGARRGPLRYATEEERLEAKRRSAREYQRRKRAAADGAAA